MNDCTPPDEFSALFTQKAMQAALSHQKRTHYWKVERDAPPGVYSFELWHKHEGRLAILEDTSELFANWVVNALNEYAQRQEDYAENDERADGSISRSDDV